MPLSSINELGLRAAVRRKIPSPRLWNWRKAISLPGVRHFDSRLIGALYFETFEKYVSNLQKYLEKYVQRFMRCLVIWLVYFFPFVRANEEGTISTKIKAGSLPPLPLVGVWVASHSQCGGSSSWNKIYSKRSHSLKQLGLKGSPGQDSRVVVVCRPKLNACWIKKVAVLTWERREERRERSRWILSKRSKTRPKQRTLGLEQYSRMC